MNRRTNTAVWLEKYHRWQINVQKDGVRKSFSSSKPGRTGQREANAKADAWLDDGIEGFNVRIDPLLDEYLTNVQLKTSDSNYRKEKTNVECYLRPAIGHKKLITLKNADLQDIIDKAFRTTNHKKGNGELSRKTLMNIRATISAFLKFCRRRNLTMLTGELLEIPKAARYQTKRILQPESVRTLFAVDTTTYYGKRVYDPFIHAYRFAVLTGVRPGELLGIERGDIFGNTVHLNKSINIRGEITQGKNSNAIRSVVLSPLALRVLNDQLYMNPDGQYVFDIPSTKYFRERWIKYCKANGIERTSLYELRHTFVSIAKTLPEGMVKSIVGHSAQMDTFGVYSHTLTSDATETTQALQNRFETILGTQE